MFIHALHSVDEGRKGVTQAGTAILLSRGAFTMKYWSKLNRAKEKEKEKEKKKEKETMEKKATNYTL